MTLKHILPAGLVAASAGSALAEGTPSYTVPSGITDGLANLQAAGTAITNAVIPVLIGVGLAFLGCWLAVKLFRWFKSAAGR